MRKIPKQNELFIKNSIIWHATKYHNHLTQITIHTLINQLILFYSSFPDIKKKIVEIAKLKPKEAKKLEIISVVTYKRLPFLVSIPSNWEVTNFILRKQKLTRKKFTFKIFEKRIWEKDFIFYADAAQKFKTQYWDNILTAF